MQRRLIFVYSCLIIGLTGCPADIRLSTQDQEKIQHDYKYKTFYLKYSLYYGQFYEYGDRYFVSERGFDERTLIETPGGEPILPPSPLGVLPMGTKMVIREIEFPTSVNLATRKLKSPRYYTWVTLEHRNKPEAKPYVLVLAHDFSTRPEVIQYLKEYLVTDDPRLAFEARPPEEVQAIDTKTIWKGMRRDALILARGDPSRVNRQFEKGIKIERWEYAPGKIVVLKDDVVDSFEGLPALLVSPAANPK
jgi:hypothetical protein